MTSQEFTMLSYLAEGLVQRWVKRLDVVAALDAESSGFEGGSEYDENLVGLRGLIQISSSARDLAKKLIRKNLILGNIIEQALKDRE